MTKFSITKQAPHWLTTATAIIALLMGSKALVIDAMPIKESIQELVGNWFTWILNTSGMICGLLSIILGVEKK